MKCIQVLPILKHTFSEELTYWTTHDFTIGDLIQIELNHRKIYAIVSSIIPLSEAKEFIKSREFNIKKIDTYRKVDFFSNAFIRACLATSKYYVRSFGEILSEYIPKHILESLHEREIIFEKDIIKNTKHHTSTYIQKPFTDRILHIKRLTEEKKNICIIVPTDAYKKHVQHHIKLMDIDTQHITIITPIDLYTLDEHAYDVCVLEYAGSEYYRHIRKGFDTRYTVRTYCKLRPLELIEMDAVLPLYTHGEHTHIETSIFPKKPEIFVVDQKVSKTARVQRTPSRAIKKISRPEDDVDFKHFFEGNIDIVTHKKLKLISPELFSLITYAHTQEEDVFIYTTRKGLSSKVTCSDCGHVMTCHICKKPYMFKQRDGAVTYECPQGHETISIDSTCPVCGSIHLHGLGSGTDALAKELSDVIHMPIITIDGDTMTQAGARNVFKKRKDKNHTPTIYIGTELALHQGIDEVFTYTAIASLETFLALPSITAELEAIRVIESLREKTTSTCVIQTRTPDHIIWKCLAEKSWKSLMTQIQIDTQELKLPPYTTHIQLYISQAYKKADQDVVAILDYLTGYADTHPIHVQDEVRHVIHLYIKDWTAQEAHISLHRYLKSLPKHVRIEVDSPSLL